MFNYFIHPHRRTGLLIFSLAVLTVLFCAKKSSRVDEGIATQTLHIANQTEPQDLDPHIVTGVPEFHILEALFEGLVIAEPKALEPVPGVAHSWDISDNGHTYTFHLRPDARWSNGDQVTAADFLFSYQRILSPRLGSEYAYMLYYVKNAKKNEKIIRFSCQTS